MIELNAQAFASFFQALWGRDPFDWQTCLAFRVLAGTDAAANGAKKAWPEAIALPTAAGKTACMDIAVFALAAQAHRLAAVQPLSAPRRIFFVVDRRVIVDEAFERARLLAVKLAQADDGIVKLVADCLRQLAGGDLPLAAHQLRGGTLRTEAWAKSPLQPMIVASTVDQLGSRLLFRGYGPGTGMWPVHAGLVGNDSLILLDEAHCAQPFLETLQAVERYRTWAQAPLPTPFQVTVMSATPPAQCKDVFHDESGQGRDPGHPLGRRQLAEKPARLRVADKAKGKQRELIHDELAKVLVDEARRLANGWSAPTGAPAAVIFCNRVDTARKVHALLAKEGGDVHLLTGRMRPLDKDDVVNAVLMRLSAEASTSRRLDAACFVVATQTLEVGANLDFDLLVTECASLDALRQRFGRLNRMGRQINASAAIVVRADQTVVDPDDPVYGAALAKTWQWLNTRTQQGVIDFGIARLMPLLPQGEALAALNAPAQHAPVLLPSHVDALAQTAPEPWPSPEVALFLHGPKSGPADVQVCWRADLTGDPSRWVDVVTLCPPTSPECLAVPYPQMRRWLAGQRSESGADVEGQPSSDEKPEPETQNVRRVVRWRGRDGSDILSGDDELRPGDVLIVPASAGGWDELATLGSAPVVDWADRAYARMRGKALLRLHPEVMKQWPASAALDRLAALSNDGPQRLDGDPDALAEDLRDALAAWAECLDGARWGWLARLAAALAADRKLVRCIAAHPAAGLVVSGWALLDKSDTQRELGDSARFSDEDDQASSGHFRSLLIEPMRDGHSHLEGVGARAALHGRLCGLPGALIEILERSGLGHDLGKADPRFQAWLMGGDPWARGPLLAKSAEMAQSRDDSRKARERAGYPQGGRHELLSVRLLESVADALPEDETLRDLLLHLVESHHGHCRPFAPVVEDTAPVDVGVAFQGRQYQANSATGLERIDAGPADRYWRLTRRYGWWGLAWLEALLRLADHRRSEWEERGAGDE